MNSKLLKKSSRNKIISENNPSEYLLSSIKESRQDKKKKDYYSFKNTKEAIKFIDEKTTPQIVKGNYPVKHLTF
jgi:hypothetical protein